MDGIVMGALTCGTKCSLAQSAPKSCAIFCSVLAVASRIDATWSSRLFMH